MKLETGPGWSDIILRVIEQYSRLPPEWDFRLQRAWRSAGRLRLHFTYAAGIESALAADVAYKAGAWTESGQTCERCGSHGWLRMGQKYALTLCERHAYLVGERHPDDGYIRDLAAASVENAYNVGVEGYGVPDVMCADFIQRWLGREIPSIDVITMLRMSSDDMRSAALAMDAEAPDEDSSLWNMIRDDGRRH